MEVIWLSLDYVVQPYVRMYEVVNVAPHTMMVCFGKWSFPFLVRNFPLFSISIVGEVHHTQK